MQKISKAIDIILYILAAIALVATISTTIMNKPVFFTSVRSDSMYPLFQRSDILLIRPSLNTEQLNIGDIVVFRSEEGSLSSKGWIVHRIVDGNDETGYTTKGDANNYTDQEAGQAGYIKREWIIAKAVAIAGKPVKIPLIGQLSLWIEQFRANPYAMPIIAVILAAIIGASELTGFKKAKKKHKSKYDLDKQLIYFLSGLTITVVIGTSMLASSQRIVIPYEVTLNEQGVLMGSSIGIVKTGQQIEKPLIQISNKGFFPIISTITSDDKQLTFSNAISTLIPGTEFTSYMTLNATTPGKYNSTVYTGMFYPFLPAKLVYWLAKKSYWMALIIISLIPGLPLMLYPVFDSKMRRKTIKEIQRFYRRIQRSIPIFS